VFTTSTEEGSFTGRIQREAVTRDARAPKRDRRAGARRSR
jgi:hypothetical protein